MCKVLEQLQTYWLYTNLKKCKFSTNIVEFLGFIVGPKGISMDPLQTKAIWNWPTSAKVFVVSWLLVVY